MFWQNLELSNDMKDAIDRLQNSHILIVGVGGIGSEIAAKLAGSHIGTLSLVDGDIIELHNLPHSTIFSQSDVGKSKVEVVANLLLQRFPNLIIHTYANMIQDCKDSVFDEPDIYICAPDNDQSRMWVNYYAVKRSKVAIFVGIGGPMNEWIGYIYHYVPNQSGCWLCFWRGGEPPEKMVTRSETGELQLDSFECPVNEPGPMLATVVGTASNLAASAAIKSVIGKGQIWPYIYFDLNKVYVEALQILQADNCSLCKPSIEYQV